ncbi:hypothetical protein [Hydrogenimonas thermophila]|uniref:Uncharacterized protein n=1 Tax=Hydrogenimonas thermophila TaxID=223786 RepID=A0A1I5N8S0_9BACT|nr:hypothetical protein [Hydrogenimonas thermophila]SFP18080.1 hypothetical protein SAMN05216234_10912 [Hydrogenimonas thermophila]
MEKYIKYLFVFVLVLLITGMYSMQEYKASAMFVAVLAFILFADLHQDDSAFKKWLDKYF